MLHPNLKNSSLVCGASYGSTNSLGQHPSSNQKVDPLGCYSNSTSLFFLHIQTFFTILPAEQPPRVFSRSSPASPFAGVHGRSLGSRSRAISWRTCALSVLQDWQMCRNYYQKIIDVELFCARGHDSVTPRSHSQQEKDTWFYGSFRETKKKPTFPITES